MGILWHPQTHCFNLKATNVFGCPSHSPSIHQPLLSTLIHNPPNLEISMTATTFHPAVPFTTPSSTPDNFTSAASYYDSRLAQLSPEAREYMMEFDKRHNIKRYLQSLPVVIADCGRQGCTRCHAGDCLSGNPTTSKAKDTRPSYSVNSEPRTTQTGKHPSFPTSDGPHTFSRPAYNANGTKSGFSRSSRPRTSQKATDPKLTRSMSQGGVPRSSSAAFTANDTKPGYSKPRTQKGVDSRSSPGPRRQVSRSSPTMSRATDRSQTNDKTSRGWFSTIVNNPITKTAALGLAAYGAYQTADHYDPELVSQATDALWTAKDTVASTANSLYGQASEAFSSYVPSVSTAGRTVGKLVYERGTNMAVGLGMAKALQATKGAYEWCTGASQVSSRSRTHRTRSRGSKGGGSYR